MLRFAPNLKSDMSIEDLRIALLTFILAKQQNEALFIRIDDANKRETPEGKDKEILEILSLFSIDYSHVVYQSENIKYHQRMAMNLLTQKKAFSCFCSNGKLEELKEEAKANNTPDCYDGFCSSLSDEAVLNTQAAFTVRIAAPKATIAFKDLLKEKCSYEPFEVDAFIILRHDKTPTPNYACAVDDMLYDISTIIQAEEHLSNTPKQMHVRHALGYEKEINYLHLPTIIHKHPSEKMSQEESANSVKWLMAEGFLPSALANYLVLLGNKTPIEIFSLEEALEWFKVEDISKNPTYFDINELRAINQKHLERLDLMRLSKLLGFADEAIGKLAKLYLEKASTLKEIQSKIDALFSSNETMLEFPKEYNLIKNCLQTAPFFNDYEALEAYVAKQTQLEGKNLLTPLHYVLTKEENGPNLSDIYPLIKNYLGEIVK